MTHAYWEENSANIQRVKYEGCNSNDELNRTKDERGVYQCCETNLNFSTATCSEDDSEYGPYKKNKVTRVGDSFLPFILTKSKPRFDIAARSNVP
jgi:hypothetical protein